MGTDGTHLIPPSSGKDPGEVLLSKFEALYEELQATCMQKLGWQLLHPCVDLGARLPKLRIRDEKLTGDQKLSALYSFAIELNVLLLDKLNREKLRGIISNNKKNERRGSYRLNLAFDYAKIFGCFISLIELVKKYLGGKNKKKQIDLLGATLSYCGMTDFERRELIRSMKLVRDYRNIAVHGCSDRKELKELDERAGIIGRPIHEVSRSVLSHANKLLEFLIGAVRKGYFDSKTNLDANRSETTINNAEAQDGN